MKKCFTINTNRTTKEIESYYQLFYKGIYHAVEIFYPNNPLSDKHKLYTDNLKKLKNSFPSIEFVLHLPHGPANDLCNEDILVDVLKIMKQAIDYAAIYGVKKLTLHLGYLKECVSRNNAITNIKIILRNLLDYCWQYQMVLMIENMPSELELGYSPEEIASIINDIGDKNLKFILDTGHAHLSDYSPVEYIEKLSKSLYHIHLNDNNGKKDEHIKLGKGTIDFHLIFQKLNNINYNGLYCLEILFDNVNDLIINACDLDKYIIN